MFKFNKKQTAKNPITLINKESKFAKPLTKEKKLKKISKRVFAKNLNIEFYKKINKYVFLAVTLGIIIFVFFIIFFTNIFTIKKIIVREGEITSENPQVLKITEVLKNRHLILTDVSSIEKTLKNNIENLEDLRIRKSYPNKLIIEYKTFEERANIVNTIGNQEIKKNYVINENGVLVSEKKINAALPYINIKTEKAFNLGDQVLKSEELTFILDAKAYFEKKMNIKIRESNYLSKPKELRMITTSNIQIWLDMSYDFKEQINKLKNAVPKINPYQESYEYIDLRIRTAEGQKIIYK